MHEVDVDPEVGSAHVREPHHRSADIESPDFCIGEALFQAHRELAYATTEIENALDLAVSGDRHSGSGSLVNLILVVAAR